MQDQYTILFEPDGIRTSVAAGTTIMDAANAVGIILDAVCGGAGTCNKCQVELDGQSEPVKACQTSVERDMTVTIPATSRFFEQKILQDGISSDAVVEPCVCKHYVQLSEPSLDDLRSDASRLIDAVEDDSNGEHRQCHDHVGTASEGTTLSTPLLSKLPSLFKGNHYAITAVCHHGRIFALEAGDTRSILYGIAVDVGTTTVVGQLVDLRDGRIVGRASGGNPQVAFGDDVVSRIKHTTDHAEGLQVLQRRIIECINQLIAQLCETNMVNPWQIYELTAAGNATMQHLLLGIPVEQIAQAPYVSVFSTGVNVPASVLGIGIHPEGNVYVMPSVAAHIGGDTVAVILATGMKHSDGIQLAVDIGTNGELALGNKERMVVCSTAAGPAFEGARITFGMRGAAGAIERVHITDDVTLSVIGGGLPGGLCGSGLIDAIAELVRVGIIDITGRIVTEQDADDTIATALRERLTMYDDKPAFILARAEQTLHKKDILLTQKDIREAQLGKAAINAGVMTLLKEFDISIADVERLYLAGAFGNYIRAESALTMGLLPVEFPVEKIQFVGNAAGAGAREVLVNRQARRLAERIGIETDYVELAGRSDFQNLYSDAMLFGSF